MLLLNNTKINDIANRTLKQSNQFTQIRKNHANNFNFEGTYAAGYT